MKYFIGKKLRNVLIEKNLKQSDIAKSMGISKQLFGTWINNKFSPSPKHFINLCHILNVPESYFMDQESALIKLLPEGFMDPKSPGFLKLPASLNPALSSVPPSAAGSRASATTDLSKDVQDCKKAVEELHSQMAILQRLVISLTNKIDKLENISQPDGRNVHQTRVRSRAS